MMSCLERKVPPDELSMEEIRGDGCYQEANIFFILTSNKCAFFVAFG